MCFAFSVRQLLALFSAIFRAVMAAADDVAPSIETMADDEWLALLLLPMSLRLLHCHVNAIDIFVRA